MSSFETYAFLIVGKADADKAVRTSDDVKLHRFLVEHLPRESIFTFSIVIAMLWDNQAALGFTAEIDID